MPGRVVAPGGGLQVRVAKCQGLAVRGGDGALLEHMQNEHMGIPLAA